MGDDRTRILDLLAAGKITSEEAARLLDALGGPIAGAGDSGASPTAAGNLVSHISPAKFIYVKVLGLEGDKVNVKIPISLVRAGLKLTSFIPQPAMEQINKSMGEHGLSMDLLNFKAEDLEELIEALREMEITVDADNGDNIRVYAA